MSFQTHVDTVLIFASCMMHYCKIRILKKHFNVFHILNSLYFVFLTFRLAVDIYCIDMWNNLMIQILDKGFPVFLPQFLDIKTKLV